MYRSTLLLVCLLSPSLSHAFAFASSVDSAPAQLLKCTSDAREAFHINGGGIGVISNEGTGGCLCNAGAGPLTFETCEGSGPQHDREVGYAFTGGPGAIPWATSGLCVTATAEGDAVALAPCVAGSPQQQWAWDEATSHVVHVSSGACLAAAPSPPPLFSTVFGSGMVLQRDVPASVWGFTTPGAAVHVEFAGAAYESLPAGADGRWSVTLPPTPAGGPYNISATDAGGKLAVLIGVLFGDVVWCSGQSNLSGGNTPVLYAFNGSEEVARASQFPWVRVFSVGTASRGSPIPLAALDHPPAIPWSPAGPAVAHFSATCWFTGKSMADALGPAIPLGLIESAWGGTSIQTWEPPSVVAACGDAPAYPGGWPTNTSGLWNSMTVPFATMRISHIIWCVMHDRVWLLPRG